MRPSWDDYFLNLAKNISQRSTCMRRKVGAVMVINNYIVSTGYNGSPSNFVNCTDSGYCLRHERNIRSGERLDLCEAVHAEINAIRQAKWRHIDLKDAILYITTQPCKQCAEAIKQAGIKAVVFSESYNQGG